MPRRRPTRTPRRAATAHRGLAAQLATALLLTLPACAPLAGRITLELAPQPAANPGVGLVRWAGPAAALGADPFPHTLEYAPLRLADLFTADGAHEWSALDRLLDEVAARGNQLIFRVVIDDPGRPVALPAHLVAAGVTVTPYAIDGTPTAAPDHEHPALRDALVGFVRALGTRYDGDPRIAAIQAGLLGAWGEWHTWPREDLFASPAVQAEILDAYTAAFTSTPILLRRPVGAGDPRYAPTTGRGFGYHDDSFAFATLDTGRAEDGWFFEPLLRAAGETEAWRSAPIGGEIRPEIQGHVFDHPPPIDRGQDFAACVAATRASWLLDAAMFRPGLDPERHRRALDAVRVLGYALRAESCAWTAERERLRLLIEVRNIGIAPCFLTWPFEFGLLAADGTLHIHAADATPAGLQPDAPPLAVRAALSVANLPPGPLTVLLRVRHPIPTGTPLRFANAGQDATRVGWLTCATLPALR